MDKRQDEPTLFEWANIDKRQGEPTLFEWANVHTIELKARAEKSDPEAMFAYGQVLQEGRICERDPSAAAFWFRRAAADGHVKAQLSYADMLDRGEGIARDVAEAARYFGMAADQGHVDGLYRLGLMHKNGRGVVRDPNEAVRLYRLAAEKGLCAAQLELAILLEGADGLRSDLPEAQYWYERAASQGSARARQRARELLHEEMNRIRERASSGEAQAQLQLAEFLDEGQGVEKDKVLALMWCSLAARSGSDEASRWLPTLRGEMTDGQIEHANRLVHSWIEQHESAPDGRE